MKCTRKITDDITWIGVDTHPHTLFEGIYPVPRGISYNSYLLIDEKTVLFDTVEQSAAPVFFENLEATLGDLPLDYIVVHHMEPDHSATLFDTLNRHPEATVICNSRALSMMRQFFGKAPKSRVVSEGEVISFGSHKISFTFAPMVHWPEVMMSYLSPEGILFSADAFGSFGALDGSIFADEVSFDRDYLDEAGRYYCNIVGKYGAQVESALRKLAPLDIKIIAPLHGLVWRKDLGYYMEKYRLWSSYTPEVNGALIAYASIYGNTALAANILACKLRELGVPTRVYDTTVTHHSTILYEAFRHSNLVVASPTYNGEIFPTLESLLRDIVSHNLKNRRVSIIENGTWAPAAAGKIKSMLEPISGTEFVGDALTLRSALTPDSEDDLDRLARAIKCSINTRK